MLTPTVAEINLDHLRHNVRALQEHAGSVPLMGVVKANAYGHGAVPIARVLQQEGVRHLAVATVPEALQLREVGIDAAILVLASPLVEYLPAYAEHGLEVTVSSKAVAEAVAETARRGGPLRVHVKVDTGMGRIGMPPEEAPSVVRRLAQAPGVTVAGVWTHLATATTREDAFGEEQLARFESVWQAVDADVERIHVAHSGALLTLPRSVDAFDRALVRVGITLYGVGPSPKLADQAQVRPVMRFTSRITQVKTVEAGTTISYGRTWTATRSTRIATVGAGYADGYPRLLSNRADVGICGRRYPVAGTVCMDMFMVDLGDPEGLGQAVAVGDEVVLWGENGPSAFEVARWAETIPYEVCCGVGARVPRRYRGTEHEVTRLK